MTVPFFLSGFVFGGEFVYGSEVVYGGEFVFDGEIYCVKQLVYFSKTCCALCYYMKIAVDFPFARV